MNFVWHSICRFASAAMIVAAASSGSATRSSEAGFFSENGQAMRKMMAAMNVGPTGNVDRDFVEIMIPHHQGAIDMARALLRYGHNERVRRLAQEIIVDQQDEIAAMRLAVGERLSTSPPQGDFP